MASSIPNSENGLIRVGIVLFFSVEIRIAILEQKNSEVENLYNKKKNTFQIILEKLYTLINLFIDSKY